MNLNSFVFFVDNDPSMECMRSLGLKCHNWKKSSGIDFESVKDCQRVFIPSNDDASIGFAQQNAGLLGAAVIDLVSHLPPGQNIASLYPLNLTLQDIQTAVEETTGFKPRKGKKQAAKPDDFIDEHIASMGYDADNYYYFKKEKKLLLGLPASGHTKNNYLSMADMHVWKQWVGRTDKMTGEDWDMITNRLMRKCGQKGYFTAEKIRGRGTWFDDHRIVVHLGDRLLVDGSEKKLGDIQSSYVYEISSPLPSLNHDVLPKEEAKQLLEICKHLRWQNKTMGVLLAGFIALVPIAGCLPWRPHIYVSGSKMSGKSTVMNQILQHVLGAWAIKPEGGSTEAGIRQQLQHDARAVIYDEAGIENDIDRARMEAIFRLARSASSSSGEIMKGDKSGHGMSFTVKGMFAFASVNPNISNDQDQSRIASLILRSVVKSDPDAVRHYQELLRMLERMSLTWCARLHARSISKVKITLENIRIFRAACQAKYGDVRKGDQFGTLLAGAYGLYEDSIVTMDQAMKWIEKNTIEDAFMGNDTVDEDRCWDYLMQHQIALSPTQKHPIGELVRTILQFDIENPIDSKVADTLLKNIGIKVEFDGWLYLAGDSVEIRKIFKDTPWRDYMTPLVKLPIYFKDKGKSIRVCGAPKKGYAFKLSVD